MSRDIKSVLCGLELPFLRQQMKDFIKNCYGKAQTPLCIIFILYANCKRHSDASSSVNLFCIFFRFPCSKYRVAISIWADSR